MSESTMNAPSTSVRPQNGWLIASTIGVALCALAMLAVGVATFRPEIVGQWFLPIMAGGMVVGGFVLFVSAWFLPERKSWRGITLVLWGFVALTSPAFGWVFLYPWCLLALTLPLIVVILRKFFRDRRATIGVL